MTQRPLVGPPPLQQFPVNVNPQWIPAPQPEANPPLTRPVEPPTEDAAPVDPVYVNAKQYARIMIRRRQRAQLEQKMTLPAVRKPYLHESRHHHASSRKRTEGGRFAKKSALTSSQPSEEEEPIQEEIEIPRTPQPQVNLAPTPNIVITPRPATPRPTTPAIEVPR